MRARRLGIRRSIIYRVWICAEIEASLRDHIGRYADMRQLHFSAAVEAMLVEHCREFRTSAIGQAPIGSQATPTPDDEPLARE